MALRLYFFHWQLRFPHALSIAIFALNSSPMVRKLRLLCLCFQLVGGGVRVKSCTRLSQMRRMFLYKLGSHIPALPRTVLVYSDIVINRNPLSFSKSVLV